MWMNFGHVCEYATTNINLLATMCGVSDTIAAPRMEATQDKRSHIWLPPFYVMAQVVTNGLGDDFPPTLKFVNEDGVVGGEMPKLDNFTWMECDVPGEFVGYVHAYLRSVTVPKYGKYAFQVLDRMTLVGTIPLRVVEPK